MYGNLSYSYAISSKTKEFMYVRSALCFFAFRYIMCIATTD